jgi:hypothetical protein
MKFNYNNNYTNDNISDKQLLIAYEKTNHVLELELLKDKNLSLQEELKHLAIENLSHIAELAKNNEINTSLLKYLKMGGDLESMLGISLPNLNSDNLNEINSTILNAITPNINNYISSSSEDYEIYEDSILFKDMTKALGNDAILKSATARRDSSNKIIWKAFKKYFTKGTDAIKTGFKNWKNPLTGIKSITHGVSTHIVNIWDTVRFSIKVNYKWFGYWLDGSKLSVGYITTLSPRRIIFYTTLGSLGIIAILATLRIIANACYVNGVVVKILNKAYYKLLGVNREELENKYIRSHKLKIYTADEFFKKSSILLNMSSDVYKLLDDTNINSQSLTKHCTNLGYTVAADGRIISPTIVSSIAPRSHKLKDLGWNFDNIKRALSDAIKLAEGYKQFNVINKAIDKISKKADSKSGNSVINVDMASVENAKRSAILAANSIKCFINETKLIIDCGIMLSKNI